MPTADLPTLRALLSRVQAATGADRELDVDLCLAFGYVGPHERSPKNLGTSSLWEPDELLYEVERDDGGPDIDCVARAPALTVSIDAAVALVARMLPDDWIELTTRSPCSVTIWDTAADDQGWSMGTSGYGATPPLAILVALLNALIVEREATDA